MNCSASRASACASAGMPQIVSASTSDAVAYG